MGVFKNGVGRPSNETIKKRRIIYALIAVIVIALISMGTYLLTGYLGLKGASSDNGVIFDIGGRTGGFRLDNAKIENLTWRTLSQINNNRLYFASDGKTVARARMRFPSSIYNLKYQYGRTANQWVKFVVYNKSGKEIATSGFKRVTGGTNGSFTYDFTVSKDANRISALVYKGNIYDNNSAGNLMNTYTIKLGLIPTITFSSQNSLTQSGGIFKATKYTDYSFTATINGNYSGDTLWARWFTYTSSAINKSTLGYKANNCSTRSFNTESKKFINLGLTVSSSLTKRGGMLAIYSSKKACDSDNDGMQKALNYQFVRLEMTLTNTWSNTQGTWTTVRYDLATIDKVIGPQAASECVKRSGRYGFYILTGKDPKGNVGQNVSFSGYTEGKDKYASSAKDLYNIIVAEINAGRPVMLRVKNNGHTLLVTGYRNVPNKNALNKTNILDYLWGIDPYSKNQPQGSRNRGVAGRGDLHHNQVSKCDSNPGSTNLKYRTFKKN